MGGTIAICCCGDLVSAGTDPMCRDHTLRTKARATDRAGHTQPLEPEWNFGGYGNNAVQRVDVIVTE